MDLSHPNTFFMEPLSRTQSTRRENRQQWLDRRAIPEPTGKPLANPKAAA
jgi:hypothetical protein